MLKQAKLTLDESEQLVELLDMDGFKVLVNKVLPALLEGRRQRLFSQELTTVESFTKLALLRAEIDGAKRLAVDVADLKKALKSAGQY